MTDLTPTILDAAGVSFSGREFNGRSLLPVLRGNKKQVYHKNDVVGFEVSGTGAIYRGDWKITRIPPPLGDGKWHLYNLARDPGETNNLADTYPTLFQSMLNEYRRYAKRVGVLDTPINESARKQLSINQMLKAMRRFWLVPVGLLLFGLLVILFLVRFMLVIVRKRANTQVSNTQ